MLNAIRRLKALVSHAVATPDEEEDSRQRRKIKCVSPTQSNIDLGRLINRDQRVMNVESGHGEGEVVKPLIWKVDIDDCESRGLQPEDAQTKALRLLRFEILYMACSMKPSEESKLDRTDPRYKPSPDYDTVKACRLVCKDWNDEISAIFLAVEKPLMIVDPLSCIQKKKSQACPESVMEILNCTMARPQQLLASDLSFPPMKLKLPTHFFYKQIENQFIHSVLPFFERYIFELHCKFPADSTMKYYWPNLNLDNLRKLKIKCSNDTKSKFGGNSHMHYNPFQHGNYMNLLQQIFNGAPNLETVIIHSHHPDYAPDIYRLHLPQNVTFLDVPLVKMSTDEFTDCLQYNLKCDRTKCKKLVGQECCCNERIKHLIVRCPLKTFRREDPIPSTYVSFLFEKYSSTLETLELDCSGQEMDHLIWTMRRDYVYEALPLQFSKPLKKLTKLTLHAGNWLINEFTNYETIFPALNTLDLTMLLNENQIKSLYQTRCNTLENLKLSFVHEMSYDVVRGFQQSFPNLRKLEVIVKERHPGLNICLQKFFRLKSLNILYTNCNTEDGKDALNTAVTGIPVDDLKLLAKNEMTILDAINLYDDNPSMRDLKELEEFTLNVRCNSNFFKLDVAIMLRTTFLRMPNLKRLTLSEKSVMIEDEQKDFIRKENIHGLSIQWANN